MQIPTAKVNMKKTISEIKAELNNQIPFDLNLQDTVRTVVDSLIIGKLNGGYGTEYLAQCFASVLYEKGYKDLNAFEIFNLFIKLNNRNKLRNGFLEWNKE